MASKTFLYRVHVYRPNGAKLGVWDQVCTRADVAVNRTKIKLYQEGKLAHFYSYVAVTN